MLDADVFERKINIVDFDVLSKGETAKINIAIALSYLTFMLKTKNVNFTFLDEIFDGLDMDNIILILKLLKKMSKKYKLNIIVINQMPLEYDFFDRVLKFEKNMFSVIEEVKK